MSTWYRTGTVTVTNGSASVAGITTGWTSGTVKTGDALFIPASSSYPGEILTVNSATSITLNANWHGTSQTSVAYFIFKGMEWGDVTRLATEISELLESRVEILGGVGAPSSGLGADGSVYFRSDVAEYYTKDAGAWSSAIALIGPQGPAGALATGTSTTSLAIGTGSKTLTTQAGLSYVVGSRIRVASSASPSNYMEGIVTSYSSTTLIFTSDRVGGSGTVASWNIAITGDVGSTGSTGASYSATSTTSLAIGTGTKAFTTQAGLAYVAGQRVRAASAADTANYMEGRITAYSSTTLTVSVDLTGGSGTLASWNIGIAGQQGIQGIQGVQGDQGIQGASGPGYAATSTTSNTVGTGNKTFTTQAGLSYVVGASRARASDSGGTNYIEGLVTAYSSTSMTIASDNTGGSGTITSWNISLAGDKGTAGADGETFVFESAYSGATAYQVNDVVTDQNSSWICVQAGTGNAPPTLPTLTNSYWEALAVAGADGDGSVDSVNGVDPVGGDVTLTASDIDIDTLTPTGYTPAGASIEQHLSGISAALLQAGVNDNYLVNADGLFNTNPVTSAADTVAIVDHWRALTQSNAISFSVQSDVADGVPKLIRLSQANASAQRMGAAQTIEAAAAKLLRGRDVTLSGKVRLSTSATVRFAVLAWTGTADGASADVIADWTNGTYTTGNFFTSTTMSLIAEGNLAVTANTLTNISLSGSVPSGANNIIVLFWTSATVIQNVTLDFRAKLETGDVGTAWVPLDPALEYARTDDLAQRLLMGTATGAALGLLTNPFFEISQENGTSSGAAASAYYAADQWYALESSSAVLAVAQTALPYSSTATLRRVPNAMRATASTASGALGAAEFVAPCVQNFEGTFWQSLGWGTADAREIDVVIIAQASVTGTYAVAVRNAAGTRSYVTTISLTANTPTLCLVTIPGDTSGTWPTTSVLGGSVAIGAATGSDRLATSLNTWDTANDLSHSSCTNFAGSGTTNFFEVAYCQIFPSGVLPFTMASQITGEALQLLLNMRRPYDDEVRRCQRYYEIVPSNKIVGTGFLTSTMLINAPFAVRKRVVPTVSLLDTSGANYHDGTNGLSGTLSIAASTQSQDGTYIQISFAGATPTNSSRAIVGFTANGIIAVNARM